MSVLNLLYCKCKDKLSVQIQTGIDKGYSHSLLKQENRYVLLKNRQYNYATN